MFLDYFALGLMLFVAVFLFYGMIVLHDIPYEIAKERNHPQQDAIHVAGWVSLFTLHAIWPFLWIWAMLYREDRGWGFQKQLQEADDSLAGIRAELHTLNARLKTLESQAGKGAAADASPPADA
ncbi:MAG: DUF3302 domain-containing protein [Thiohalocapsa sp.]|nr:DUF3302 domain-containing protein [Thiohalocapsa sp.]MCF7992395.1 DUF3302 domain-containing protein [Thiohalocapsa sp.]